MTTVTINGNTYSADGSSPKDMTNGGHRTWFIPLVSDVATVAGVVAGQAAQTAIDATNAANGAAATRGTSTTSLTIAAGTTGTITTQSGKQFVVGNYVTISRTSAPTTLMHGIVTSYGGTALVVDVSTVSGSGGPFTDWTIALSGAKGNTGATGNGNVAYVAKTAAYTVVSTDAGKLIDCTTGTFTLSFQAVASLGANWFGYIRNSGTGVITLDPNLAETINGASTYTLTAGSTAVVQCDGSVLRTVTVGPNQLIRVPIFDASTATMGGASSLDVMENSLPSTTITSTSIVFGNSLFVVAPGIGGAAGTVATSPDGTTWTQRTMPSSAQWQVGTNGSNQFVACVQAATTVAKSADGITWASATNALPGASVATSAIPVYVGNICLVISNTASTAYTSSDMGATAWTTQTLPGTVTGSVFSVGGLFWYQTSTTQAYTSATGATGSWTLRTLPVTSPQLVAQDFDGALICRATSGNYFRTTDGFTWSNLGFGQMASTGTSQIRTINGIYCSFTVGAGFASSRHSGAWVARLTSAGEVTNSYARCAKNTGGTVFLMPTLATTVIRVAPTESTASTALFTR